MTNLAVKDQADTLDAEAAPSSRAVGLIQLAFACGSFGIGTGEFMIMGLLPQVASSFALTVPQAGYAISAYALGVVIGSPLVAVLTTKMARKTVLLMLMAAFAIGNVASGLAPNFESFLFLRFLTGFPHGAYFGLASIVAASMMPPQRRARAVGRVLMGLTIATLLGTPVVTVFGQSLNWRFAFVFVGAIGLLAMALIAYYLPRGKAIEGASFRRELTAFQRPQVLLTLGIAAVGFSGMFAMFSYIAPTTTQVAGLPQGMVAVMLVLFGVGMNVGNIVGSRLGDKSLLGTIGGCLVFNMIVLLLFALTASDPIMLGLCVFGIGAGVAAGPPIQTRLMDVAADAQMLAAASHHSAFNTANALGAWLGGIVIAAGYGYPSTGYVGAVLSFLGMFVFAASYYLERRAPRP